MNYYERTELSNSKIKLINRSYREFLGAGGKVTPAMVEGNAFHTYMLEPEEFDRRYVFKPEGLSFATKDGKLWRSAQLENGLQIIDADCKDKFFYMKRNLMEHRLSHLLLGDNEVEKEIYFNFNGVDCKAKLDLINHSNKIIFDYKTIEDCQNAEKTCRFEYGQQAYFYQQAVFAEYKEYYDFIFIFCEKKFPNECKFIRLSNESLEYGIDKIHSGIERYKYLIENPECFKGYADDIIIV